MQEQKTNRHNQKRPVTGKIFLLLPLFICLLVIPNRWGAPLPGPLCNAEAEQSVTPKKETPAPKKSDPSVTVYVTSWCPACSMAINYLKQKKVPFTVKDVEKNPDYLKEMVSKIGGYRGVPVLDINGKTYLGFHPSLVDNLVD